MSWDHINRSAIGLKGDVVDPGREVTGTLRANWTMKEGQVNLDPLLSMPQGQADLILLDPSILWLFVSLFYSI